MLLLADFAEASWLRKVKKAAVAHRDQLEDDEAKVSQHALQIVASSS